MPGHVSATANIAGSVDRVPGKNGTHSRRVHSASVSRLPRTHQCDGHYFSINDEINQLEKKLAFGRKIDQGLQYTPST
jgi:hypothetical protein